MLGHLIIPVVAAIPIVIAIVVIIHKVRPGGRRPRSERHSNGIWAMVGAELANAWHWLRSRAGRGRDDVRGRLEDRARRRDHPWDPPPGGPTAPSVTRRRTQPGPAGGRGRGDSRSAITGGGRGGALRVSPAEMSPECRAVVSLVATFEPGTDEEMLDFTRGWVAFLLGLSEAWENVLEHHLNAIGMDPAALHALADFADGEAESAENAAKIIRMILGYHQGVEAWIADGGELPATGYLTGLEDDGLGAA